MSEHAEQAGQDDVEYFELPEKKVAINIRVRTSLKKQLQDVVRLWTLMAEAKGSDPGDIDLTFVCERLLLVGVEGVWAQVGAVGGIEGMPKSDEEWATLAKALAREAKASKK